MAASHSEVHKIGVWVAGRYPGCYVRITVSGDYSDHALASDTHLHTCGAVMR